MVIEDDPSWQQILAEILTDEGLTVDLADNVEAAVACLRATPHRLAIVDLSLGKEDHRNQDGLAILEAVRRHDPGCQALLLTGYATVELAVRVLTEFGAFTCLRKETFRRAEFRSVVRQALGWSASANGSRSRHIAAQGGGWRHTAGCDRRLTPKPVTRRHEQANRFWPWSSKMTEAGAAF